jgi:hypothetical protein
VDDEVAAWRAGLLDLTADGELPLPPVGMALELDDDLFEYMACLPMLTLRCPLWQWLEQCLLWQRAVATVLATKYFVESIAAAQAAPR